MNTLAQRLALYFALGMVLASLEVTYVMWQFWSVIALFWVNEFMVRKGTEETAMAQGVTQYLGMTATEQDRIKKLYHDTMKEQNDR